MRVHNMIVMDDAPKRITACSRCQIYCGSSTCLWMPPHTDMSRCSMNVMNVVRFTTVPELAESYLTHIGHQIGTTYVPLCVINTKDSSWIVSRGMVNCPTCTSLYDATYERLQTAGGTMYQGIRSLLT
jgi:hypothetical protein